MKLEKNIRSRIRKRISLLLFIGLLAFFVGGCQAKQGDSTSDPTAQAATEAPVALTEASTEQPASSVIVRTVATLKGDYQEVAIDLKSDSYGPIVVQKGIPVKFNIRATEDTITGCNNTVVFNDFKAEIALKPGDNIVEFTPSEVGSFQYDCWMGMIYSTVKVVDDLSVLDETGN